MSQVSFPGEPPFDLPTAQSGSAIAAGEIVEVTLRVVVPGREPTPQAVRVAMTWKTAHKLLDDLLPAALEAEAGASKRTQP